MHSRPMIAVRNVQASAEWYRQLLACASEAVADDFARITSDGGVLLLLHDRRAEEHGAWDARGTDRAGDGFLLWIVVEDFDGVYARARTLGAPILVEPHDNPEDDAREFTLRDPDGYAIGVTEGSM